jgi:hypothetical protein
MKRIGLVRQQQLLKHAISELEAMGFNKVENQSRDYYKQTRVGGLGITPRIENTGLDLFGKFDDAEMAKKEFECNPYSGKHNHLFLTTEHEISNALAFY